MSSPLAIEVNNLSKLYRLGVLGTGTISHDLNRMFSKLSGKGDPYEKIGQVNDRSSKRESDYVWALKDINLQIKKGEVLGVVGRNGAGKSTLLKIMSKITGPTAGSIKIKGRIASLLEVGTGFHPEMTGRENVFMNGAILGMRKWEIKKKFDEIVDFSGIGAYIDTPVKRFSSGMKVRLGFAVAAYLEPEILIVDEVLAVGDMEFQKKCLGRMHDVSAADGRTILFVSHNMAAMNQLCTRGIMLHNGMLFHDGPMHEISELYLKGQLNSAENIDIKDSYFRYVEIRQVNDCLKITCSFESDLLLTKPILGFIISDHAGQKIFGTNSLYQPPETPIQPCKSAKIDVDISYPKLQIGRAHV